jgi:oxygen-independent coproporphyrinogen-3 oxidase
MKKELQLYLHIPFCAQKCNYCDFLSAPAEFSVQEAYLEALITELRNRGEAYRGYEVVSLFIGGGTPSLLPAKYIVQLMKTIKENYQCVPCDGKIWEATIEANPESFTEEKAAEYRQAGINRLSLGLQSANDEELKRLGRIHTFDQFLCAYQAARKAGFTNINVDLMSALPGQTSSEYLQTLSTVLALDPPPEHLSAYSLIIEENTPFWEQQEKGYLNLPNEELDRKMYHDTKCILQKNNYSRYEISNYAKNGYECFHNIGYWTRRDYAGYGIGAASLINNTRFSNTKSLTEYTSYWNQPQSNQPQSNQPQKNQPQSNLALPIYNRQTLTQKDQMEEFMFLGLRLTKGISENQFQEQFGTPIQQVYGEVIQKNEKDGLLDSHRDYLRLTEKGLDLSNYVMSQFLLD